MALSNVLAIPTVLVETAKVTILSFQNIRGRLSFISKFLGDLSLPIKGKLTEKITNILDEWRGYPKILSFTFSIEISRLYLLLRTDMLQKTVVAGVSLVGSSHI